MLATGHIVEVQVVNVAIFGLFCLHAEQEVMVLIPDCSWIASFNSCYQFAEPGDRFTVKIVNVDSKRGRVAASITALHPDPWDTQLLTVGRIHQARVARYVERADRCQDAPGYLLELVPGGYAMMYADDFSLSRNQHITVTISESDRSRRAVRVVVK